MWHNSILSLHTYQCCENISQCSQHSWSIVIIRSYFSVSCCLYPGMIELCNHASPKLWIGENANLISGNQILNIRNIANVMQHPFKKSFYSIHSIHFRITFIQALTIRDTWKIPCGEQCSIWGASEWKSRSKNTSIGKAWTNIIMFMQYIRQIVRLQLTILNCKWPYTSKFSWPKESLNIRFYLKEASMRYFEMRAVTERPCGQANIVLCILCLHW